MKKMSFCCLLALALTLSLLPVSLAETAEEPIRIVCTIFPQYDWVREIIGDRADNFELTLLLDTGVDLHSYQPTVGDIVKISEADLFIYVGGESDAWVDRVLVSAQNEDLIAVNLLECLGDAVKQEEIVEGMQVTAHTHDHDHEAEEAHDHDHETEEAHDHDHDHEHEAEEAHDHDHDHEEGEADEHVWLSLRNAQALCDVLARQIEAIDPANADVYAANAAAYIQKLKALDARYQAAVDAGTKKVVLFGDRFPFRYLVDDYGLAYYAAFFGCSAESEASFETIMFLAAKVDELGLHAVMTLEGTDHSIAETVIGATRDKNAQVLSMDSLQSVTQSDIENGIRYLDAMEKNLKALTAALR